MFFIYFVMKSKLFFIFIMLISVIKSYGQVPDWAWAKSAGGAFADEGNCVTTDNVGNVYITGSFNSSTITFGNVVLNNADINNTSSDIYIAKYDALGNVVWARRTGGNVSDISKSITTDNMGNVYISGSFKSSTITFGNITIENSGNSDLFIAKYDNMGNVLWAKSATGTQNSFEQCNSINTDDFGNLYITGTFNNSIIFDNTVINHFCSPESSYCDNIFIAKYDALGNIIWVKKSEGSLENMSVSGLNLAIDNQNNIYITGVYSGSIFFDDNNHSISNGGYDLFITKFDVLGNALWTKSAGGNGSDQSNSITTDNLGNVYITGEFKSTVINFNNISLNHSGNIGNKDIFIAKYSSNGDILWAKKANGLYNEYSKSIVADNYGNTYITGCFEGPSINFDNITLNKNPNNTGVFVTKYDNNGNVLWAKSPIGDLGEYSNSITFDNMNNIYITGGFLGNNISFGSYTLNNSMNNSEEIFLAKLNICSLPQPTITASGPTTFCVGDSVTLTSSEANSYLWSNSATTQLITTQTSGFYWVQITDENGCTARDSIIINVLPTPIVNLGRDTVICNNEINLFTLNAANPNSLYLWNTGATTQIISVTSQGLYSVLVTSANGCTSSDEINVDFKPPIYVNLGKDSIMCPGELITLSAGNGYDSYLWSDGSTFNYLDVRYPGTYSLIVKKDGCYASDEVKIKECDTEIWFPNAFTPNSDGNNDLFYPVYNNIGIQTLYVYNRWGNKIYEGSGKNATWNGKQNGEICPSGVYYYVFDYEEKGENHRKNRRLHGTLTLLR